jgi:hypothetical protein
LEETIATLQNALIIRERKNIARKSSISHQAKKKKGGKT